MYPTHANLEEELRRYQSRGLEASVYPARTTEGTRYQEVNCWNRDADRAEAAGFPVGKTICMSCAHRDQCLSDGYLRQIIDAGEATVGLATHTRLLHTGFEELCRDREYVAIHEDPVNLLKPTFGLEVQDLFLIRQFVNELLSDPFWLDWFADCSVKDREGKTCEDEQKRIRRERHLAATHVLADLLDDLHRTIENAVNTIPVVDPHNDFHPTQGTRIFCGGVHGSRNSMCQVPPGNSFLPLLSGYLQQTTILVTPKHVRGAKQGAVSYTTSVVGIRENRPPRGKTF